MVTVMVTIDTIHGETIKGTDLSASKARSLGANTWIARARLAMVRWWMLRSTRIHLADLDDHLLRDVGLTRHEAREELKKSFYVS